MNAAHYHLKDFLIYNQTFHIVHREIEHNVVLHDHNYYEIFWITNGSGFQIVNKHLMQLKKSDMVFIRPSDQHSIYSGIDGMSLINISFSQETANLYKKRYMENSEQKLYFWSESLLPSKIHISNITLNIINDAAHDTMQRTANNIQLDTLLLTIFRQIMNTGETKTPFLPNWLNHSLSMYKTPAQFRLGKTGFAESCNRNIDYVNRIVKQYFNKTLTEVLNEKKMRYAAIQLSQLETPIKRICSDCGFNNLGHFFRLFKKYYGSTPNQYRRRHLHLI
ncbi:MAG: helix-turn-helix transcriptional regulator [Bacteroidales bacterium]|jgi:AraC family cel operon transcriptional repressor|nr:helix-turn-helix transcriptional regulator [Bacteroidales bacterium]